ncbi:carboxylesterase/lipase family protein [Plantactinospora sonchi]|uniref:Carboxylic ester hydrolase n=1 Tax=Plantactinospora sonchi TaxID=1544735 RepID=A0ABU7S1X4_9ACTN
MRMTGWSARRWRLPGAVGALGAVILTLAVAPTGGSATVDTDSRSDRNPAVVRTESGAVRGTVAADHRSFLGVPYAAPPVGALRWTSPRPAPAWTGVRDATVPAPACAQLPGLPMDRPSVAEDCLYLNVTTPPRESERRLPVLVWIHGGHFLFGQGDTYGGQRLAADGDVVVVTVNYRLGPLGFLALPGLESAPGAGTSGNFGLEDQQAALRWVRANAASFGGDPGNVTIAGQSAGATSVCAHLAAPGSRGLFHRAIVQSNACTNPVRTRREAYAGGAALGTAAGCDRHPAGVAACLRELSASELVERAGYPGRGPWEPGLVAGGPVLPVDPAAALASGAFHRVPMLVGVTRDEYRAQVWGMERTGMLCPPKKQAPCPLTGTQYREQVEATFGADAPAVLRRYPLPRPDKASEVLGAVMTDHQYVRPMLDTVTATSRHVPTYAYEFADRQAPFFTEAATPSFPTGAYHLSELPYLFAVGYARPLSTDQTALSTAMVRYWSSFAHTGDPNRSDLPEWPRWQAQAGYVQALAPGRDGIGRTDLERDHHVPFWRSIID